MTPGQVYKLSDTLLKRRHVIMENNNNTELEQAQKTNTEGKTFTQDEVNKIVQERLARSKGSNKELENTLATKEKELQAREMALVTKELLISNNMDNRLADIITGETKEEIESKLKILKQVYGTNEQEEKKFRGFMQIGADGSKGSTPDVIGRAMGLRR